MAAVGKARVCFVRRRDCRAPQQGERLLCSIKNSILYPGVAQLVARLLWEQDAASSSLATWTKNMGMASCHSHIFILIVRLEKSNAARMSAAGESSPESILYLRQVAQMQTSLAT